MKRASGKTFRGEVRGTWAWHKEAVENGLIVVFFQKFQTTTTFVGQRKFKVGQTNIHQPRPPTFCLNVIVNFPQTSTTLKKNAVSNPSRSQLQSQQFPCNQSIPKVFNAPFSYRATKHRRNGFCLYKKFFTAF